jgi:enamine deaminase RidA (YjgF/YER057c/UK114 family)
VAEIKIYNVDALGKPVGPYSHVARVKAGAETLYIAGMLAPGESFEAQCAAVYAQIEKALQSAGGGWKNVVQFTTYLVHSQDIARFYRWREQNYPKMFPGGAYPPNTLLIVDRLVQEQFLIEIQTIAAV